MAERETREEAQERILILQAELMERLEKNPKYQELSWQHQDQLVQTLMPHLFDPKYEIQKLLENIQVCKSLIKSADSYALRNPEVSEEVAELIRLERKCIAEYIEEIKRIKRGEFEWVVK